MASPGCGSQTGSPSPSPRAGRSRVIVLPAAGPELGLVFFFFFLPSLPLFCAADLKGNKRLRIIIIIKEGERERRKESREVEEEGELLKEAIRIIKGGRALYLLERAALERAFEKWCCFPVVHAPIGGVY